MQHKAANVTQTKTTKEKLKKEIERLTAGEKQKQKRQIDLSSDRRQFSTRAA